MAYSRLPSRFISRRSKVDAVIVLNIILFSYRAFIFFFIALLFPSSMEFYKELAHLVASGIVPAIAYYYARRGWKVFLWMHYILWMNVAWAVTGIIMTLFLLAMG